MRILNAVGYGVAVVPTTADFEAWRVVTQAQINSKSAMVKRGNQMNLVLIELSLNELNEYREKYEKEIKESLKTPKMIEEKQEPNLSESEIWTALAGRIGAELIEAKRIEIMKR